MHVSSLVVPPPPGGYLLTSLLFALAYENGCRQIPANKGFTGKFLQTNGLQANYCIDWGYALSSPLLLNAKAPLPIWLGAFVFFFYSTGLTITNRSTFF